LRKSAGEAVTWSCRKITSGTITVPVPDHGEIRIGTLQSIIRNQFWIFDLDSAWISAEYKITSRRAALNPSSLFIFATKFKLPTAIASDQQRLVQTVPAFNRYALVPRTEFSKSRMRMPRQPLLQGAC